MGETYFLSTMAALLARAVREQGRDDEALALTGHRRSDAADDDVDAQALWRCVRAPILARRGELGEAEALARAGLDLALQQETPALRGTAHSDLAAVLSRAGRAEEARRALEDAIAIYKAKGDLSSLGRAREAPAHDPVKRRGPQAPFCSDVASYQDMTPLWRAQMMNFR